LSLTHHHHTQAFWDSLVDDLRLATPCYVRVLRVLAEIRDGIMDLAGSREEIFLRDAIDLDFIRQQAEAGLYDWASCTKLVASIVQVAWPVCHTYMLHTMLMTLLLCR
jgi:hypothetical protein